MPDATGRAGAADITGQPRLSLVPRPVERPADVDARTGRWAPWVILVVGFGLGVLTFDQGTGEANPVMLGIGMAAMFGALVLRLLACSRRSPGQRPALAALIVGILLWAAGGVALAASEAAATAVVFPAPGEWLFLGAFIAFAAFVFLDAQPANARHSAAAWADAAILCGGAAAVASMVMLTPLAHAYPDAGVGMLVAWGFPLADLSLVLLVIGQWGLGLRPGDRRTALLVAGLAVFTLAEATLVLSMGSGQYSLSMVSDAVWAVGFILIVDAACRPRPTAGRVPVRRVPSSLLLVGFVVALLMLALRPEGLVGLLVSVSCLVVLSASGVRLVMALHTARTASDALRLTAVDDLTGLPNRRALMRRIDGVIATRERAGLLIADLDGFKDVNDGLGHTAGDYLLRVVCERIGELLPSGALLARLGGDEFAIVLKTDDPVVLHELGTAIRATVARPIGVDGLAVALRLSIGITWRTDADVVDVDLLRRADLALYAAKRAGGGVETYRDTGDGLSRRRLLMAQELREALRSGAITVWYQPKILATTGEVEGLEALVRWDHPRDGMIAPAAFLPLARREGLMLELSRQVVDRAVDDLAAWRRGGLDVAVAVNIAPPELLDGAMVPYLLERLAVAGVPPWHVTVEVTEETFLLDPERGRRVIEEAREAGLNAAIDDFGTGFSSLAYLRDLPVSEVKIDRTFLAAVVTDPRSAVIVSSTVAMAHALGMRVVAEGVETEAVAARAIVLGVDALQGFYVTRPMPAEEVASFVSGLAVARRAD